MNRISHLTLYGVSLGSRLMLGTSQYPSPAILAEAARACGRRNCHRLAAARIGAAEGGAGLLAAHPRHRRARAAQHRRLLQRQGGGDDGEMAREVFGTPWIKLEVIGEADTLQPDVFGLVEAARILSRRRLRGLPLYDGGSRCRRAADRGRMPGADAVGLADRLGQGAQQPVRPARAARAFSRRAADRRRRPRPALARRGGDGARLDGVLLNTAVAKAGDPVAMARAFGQAIEAGRAAFLAGPMQPRDMAAPSTPVVGKAVLT